LIKTRLNQEFRITKWGNNILDGLKRKGEDMDTVTGQLNLEESKEDFSEALLHPLCPSLPKEADSDIRCIVESLDSAEIVAIRRELERPETPSSLWLEQLLKIAAQLRTPSTEE
jgi:hypothetical protein